MALVTVGGVAAVRGSIAFSLSGTWEAEVVVSDDSTSSVTGSVTLKVGDTELTGYATPGQDLGDLVSVRVVGGAGGFDEPIGPQGYRASTTRRTVLQEALSAGGESLSSTSDSAILDVAGRWTRVAGTVGGAARALVAYAGATWRVLDDGSVWVGTDSWDTVTPEHTVESETPTRSRMVVSLDGLDVRPGDTFRDQRIVEAIYRFNDRELRAELRYGEDDGIAGILSTLVRRELGGVDYSAIYAYSIVGQTSSGALNVKSTDARLPHLDEVDVRVGIVGVAENKVIAGGTAYLTHENGDPTKPIIVAVDQRQGQTLVISQAEKIELTAGQTLKVSASSVECGGQQALVLNIPLVTWASSVVAAIASLGGSCPALVGSGTTITGGA